MSITVENRRVVAAGPQNLQRYHTVLALKWLIYFPCCYLELAVNQGAMKLRDTLPG